MNLTPELVRAFTPIFLGLMGSAIGLTALVVLPNGDKLTAALGLAGTAIAGAAGLAQSPQSEPGVSIERDGQNLKIDSLQVSDSLNTSKEVR